MDQCGKILLPTLKKILGSLPLLLDRAKENGVDAYLLTGADLRAMEPNYNPIFDKGLHVLFTSVVDPEEVAGSILADLSKLGGEVLHSHQVTEVNADDGSLLAETKRFRDMVVINTAGLHADTIAGLSGLESSYSFLPFKGKYWRVETPNRMRKLVYPIPNLDLPFLGVHTAHDRTGETYLGASSSPVLGRENYRGLNGLHTLEFLALFVSFSKKILFNVSGLRGLAFRKLGLMLPGGIYREANRLIQADQGIKLNISPDKVGIRSQIFDGENNYLVSDFVIKKQAPVIHILNAISLAFTASFGLADMVMDRYIS